MDARVYNSVDAMQPQAPNLAALAPAIDLHHQIAIFRRRMRLFLAIAVVVFIATVLVTFRLTPRYTATGEVMLDPRQEKVTDVQEVLSGLPADTTAVDSEVDVIKSRGLAEKVVTALNLDRDPEFNGALRPLHFPQTLFKPKPVPKVLTLAQSAKAHDGVVDAVMGGLKVARSGLTYGIKVSYTSTSPSKAAQLANAFADHYLLEQLDAKFDATRRASDWLSERLAGLKTQVEQADAAVARYKSAHGLMGLSTGDGATITQQEISNLDTQLATARAQQAEADANLNTAKQQLSRGSSGDDLGATLGSTVINQLRQQRAQISSQVADLQGRYGALHPELLKAKRQLADIDGQIQSEIKRITSNLEAQSQVAEQRAESIQKSLAGAKGTLSDNGNASVGLSDLERNAASLSTLYQNYLDRFKQTQSQQSIQQSDAHVISKAKAPGAPSFPNKPLSIALGLVLAVAAALGATVLLAALDVGLNTSEDVEKLMGMTYLGAIPLLSSVAKGKKAQSEMSKLSPTDLVVAQPLSSFAEAFRNLRTSVIVSKLGEPVSVIAVTSSLPGEGKTTTCICLGRVLGLGGTKTVVVDCDLRRRSMNQLFEVGPKLGLMEVLAGLCTLDEALVLDEGSGAAFLPLADAKFTAKDVFSSAAMDRLLLELRARFDIIILDTAPVLPVADTRVLAPKADVTVFLAQWRKTPRKALENALKQIESGGAYVSGIALTQMDMKEQARSGYGDAGYYYGSYQKYYGS